VAEFEIKWNPEKNEWLKLNRGLSFDQIEAAMSAGCIVDDILHPQRPNQRILVVRLDETICAVPYVLDGNILFLKTAYRSRKLQFVYGNIRNA
jgi:uncharacterized DUF497 family protein